MSTAKLDFDCFPAERHCNSRVRTKAVAQALQQKSQKRIAGGTQSSKTAQIRCKQDTRPTSHRGRHHTSTSYERAMVRRVRKDKHQRETSHKIRETASYAASQGEPLEEGDTRLNFLIFIVERRPSKKRRLSQQFADNREYYLHCCRWPKVSSHAKR